MLSIQEILEKPEYPVKPGMEEQNELLMARMDQDLDCYITSEDVYEYELCAAGIVSRGNGGE